MKNRLKNINFIKYLSFLELSTKRLLVINLLMIMVVFFEGFSVTLFVPLIFGVSTLENTLVSSLYKYLEEVSGNIDKTLVILFFITVTILMRQFFIFSKDYLIGITQARSLEKLRNKILRILFLSKMQVFIKKQTGEFTNLLFEGPLQSVNLVTSSSNIIFSFILLLGYFLLLVIFASKIAFVILIIGIIFYVISIFLGQISKKIGTNVKNYNKSIFGVITDYVRGIKLIKIKNFENKIISIISNKFEKLTENAIKYELVKALIKSISPLIIIFLFLTLIFLFNFDKDFNVSFIAIIIFLIIRIQQAITQLNSEYAVYHNYLPHLLYVYDFLINNKKNPSYTKKIQKKITFNKKISLKNISFFYDEASKIKNLKSININFTKNRTTGIFGPTGAGKSTILELLLMNYKPKNGQIIIDDVEFDDSYLLDYRSKIALVSQENLFFNNTLIYNLTFGLNKKIKESEILKVLDTVDLKNEILKNKKKLNYNIGESGNKFSGGQKQRLSLARALLSSYEILILDEPTSSLDNETEDTIIKVIKKIQGNKTIIIVSHSEKIMKICDNVYTITNGVVKKHR